jgi:cytochrome c oxidase assembly protein subunit 15
MESDPPAVDATRPRYSLPLRRFRQLAIVTVAGVCLLTVAGAIVRLTGSGLGCDDWPNCNNERFIDVSTGHAAIEQLNRLLSGVIGVPTLLLAIGAFRVFPRRAGLRWPSVGVLVTILGNGVVGGLAVRGDLHPSLVQSHFILAMLSIGFGMIAVHRSHPTPVGDRRSVGVTTSAAALFAGLVVVVAAALVTGTVVTGAGPHAGDETARRYGFDISTVAEVHSVVVWIAVVVFLALVITLRRTPAAYRRLSSNLSTWMFVAVVQGGIGYVQYFTDVPAVLVAAHVAGATALWVFTVRLVLSGFEPIRVVPAEVHTPETGDALEISPASMPSA